ncbi:MAG: hypothetical protein GY771_11960, partial [bacterium]|nr:hypothetical protein [bacterium]
VIYKGDPDELVQEAAFGDIMLSLPGTEFVSYSSSRSVFGAKVDLKYKWARLMVIASREKGKAEQTTFTGGNELTNSEINDTDYEKRKYYRLNAGRNPTTTGDFFESSNIKIASDNGIPKVVLYIYRPSKPIGDIDLNKRDDITAYEYEDNGVNDDQPHESHKHEDYEHHNVWERLDQTTDYDINTETGVITMQTQVNEEDSLAVAYAVENSAGPGYSVGYEGNSPNFDDMKLIKTSGNGGDVQRYELKNRYYLGSSSIVANSLIIKMWDTARSEGYNGKKYLNIFGLDRDNDGDVDSGFIDETFGLLYVPDDFESGGNYFHRDRTNPDEGAPDEYNDFLPFDYRVKADEDQYNENSGDGVVEDPVGYDAYSPGVLENKYTIYVEYQASRPSFILRPNIVPGSEVVTLDGVRLFINRDYWIDYDSGFIEFLNDDVNEPGRVLQITYEYKPFFELSTKSLVGSRFEFGPDEYNYVGCTFLGEYSEKPRGEDQPELGGEPANSQVFDADLKIELYPEFMTKMMDVLPVVHTNEKSKLAFEAEIARSFRNPNIMGKAKVEDFESAKQENSFPMRTAAWAHSSAPAARADIDQSNRTEIKWDNKLWFKIDIDETWRDDQVELLRVKSLPTEPVSGGIGDESDSWGSMIRPLSITGTDFIDDRYDTLKITLNLNGLTDDDESDDIDGGLFHIDLGEVNEDTDEDGYLDSEDGPAVEDRDGILQRDEDVGWTFDNRDATPPGNIDFVFGNDNQLLDEEDLNNDDELDTYESYFTYGIDLGDVISGNSPYVSRTGGGANETLKAGWYILEIPLNLDTGLAETWNNPDPTRIKQIRLWFEATDENDFPGGSAINFYSMYLSSVRWDPPKLDPDKGLNEIEISTKDSESNSESEYDPLNPITDEENNVQREQALVFNYIYNDWDDIGVTEEQYDEDGDFIGVRVYGANNGIFDTEDVNHNAILDDGEDIGLGPNGIGASNQRLDQEPPINGYTAMTNYTPDDYTDYREMEIWVHNFTPRTDNQDYFFLRFGSDENNYYEYRHQFPGGTGWRPYRIDLDFFSKLQLKGAPLLIDEDEGNVDDEEIAESGHYFIKGSPSLLDIRKVIIGTATNNPEDHGYGGFVEPREVWFNNIMLMGVKESVGLAKRANAELDFGGFIRLGGAAKKIDADFSSIGTISSSDQENTTKSLDGTLEFSKFMPDGWGVRMPLSGAWNNSVTVTEAKY